MADWRTLHSRYVGSKPARYRVLLADTVSPEVRRRWAARGLDLDTMVKPRGDVRSAPGMLRRNFIMSRSLFIGSGVATAGATASTGGIMALVTALDLASGPVGLIWTGGVAAVFGAGTVWTGSRYARDPRRLRRAERRSAQRAEWITPNTLRRSAGKLYLETDEQMLFHLLVRISRQIVRTHAWTHESTRGQISRLDLDHLISALGARLRDIARLRAEIDAIDAPHTKAKLDQVRRQIQKAFDSAAERVVGVEGYLQRLRVLDEKLLRLQQLEASRDLGERVLDVVARTADDEDAAWRVADLNLEAEAQSEAIEQMLSDLEDTAEELSFDTGREAPDLEAIAAPRRTDAPAVEPTPSRDEAAAVESTVKRSAED